MGYSIEVSFDILKNSSVSELKSNVIQLANECGCKYYYDIYEFEKNTQFRRAHCVLNLNFEETTTNFLVEFLRKIKKSEEIYIESIFEDDTNKLLYASKYYLTQKMDKGIAKNFKANRRERSYSEDDKMILNVVENKH